MRAARIGRAGGEVFGWLGSNTHVTHTHTHTHTHVCACMRVRVRACVRDVTGHTLLYSGT